MNQSNLTKYKNLKREMRIINERTMEPSKILQDIISNRKRFEESGRSLVGQYEQLSSSIAFYSSSKDKIKEQISKKEYNNYEGKRQLETQIESLNLNLFVANREISLLKKEYDSHISYLSRSSSQISDYEKQLKELRGESERVGKEIDELVRGLGDTDLFKLGCEDPGVHWEIANRLNKKQDSYVVHNTTLKTYEKLPSFEALFPKKKLFKNTETTKFKFVSHKWYQDEPDDDDNSLLRYLQGLPEGFYWVDYCCIPQSDFELKVSMLKSIPDLIKSPVIIYPNNSDYQRSIWCAFECLNQPEESLTLWEELYPLKDPNDAGLISLSLLICFKENKVRSKLIEYFRNVF